MSTNQQRYDAVVIGTGQAGKPLARALAGAGKRTAVIERGDIGGTCVNVGCTPTKTWVASARLAHMARRGGEYGVLTGDVGVDMLQVRRRKQEIVEDFRNGSTERLRKTEGLDLFFGSARFTGPRTVSVDLRDGDRLEIEAGSVFINTGGRPVLPPIEGIDSVGALDSSSILEVDAIPEHLVIVGGGYIGLEFGQMFRRFGAEVTILQRGPQLVPREDEDIAEEIARILDDEGIRILFNVETKHVERAEDARICVDVNTPEGPARLVASQLLVAAGRQPNSDDLDVGRAGIEVDARGFIVVNDRLETSVPGVYALGDVNGGPAFTHIAYDDYRVVEANVLLGGKRTRQGRLVPYTLFTDPELGRVGLSERAARAAGHSVRVARLPMSGVARAIERSETRGFMKAVVDAQTDRILGCAILGTNGGEIMSVLQVAMMADMPYTTIRDAIFAHPTLAESLNNLFLALDSP